MAAVTLQVLGGVGTIGGTKVLIRDGDDAVLLDCGLAYAPGSDWFEGPVRPRGVGDLVAMGLAPDLPALYDAAAGAPPSVFVTHAHQDHMALLPYVGEHVPVFVTAETACLLQALRSLDPAVDRPRRYRVAAAGEAVRCGRLAVTALPVDHDVPGACAFLVDTRAGCVAYSGDLRLHGLHPERTWAFVTAAAARRPAVLLLEGTTLAPPEPGAGRPDPGGREADVPRRAAAAMRAAGGLVLFGSYPRDLERNLALCRAAAAAGRRAALAPETAALLRACGGGLPPGAAVLGEGVAPAAIAGAARGWAVQLGLAAFPLLLDLRPPAGSVYLLAGDEPFGPRHPWWSLHRRWLERFGLAAVPVGCSGHARPEDLARIAAGVGPATLMPVHSRHPELLAPPGLRVLLPELGRVYDVAELAA